MVSLFFFFSPMQVARNGFFQARECGTRIAVFVVTRLCILVELFIFSSSFFFCPLVRPMEEDADSPSGPFFFDGLDR